ncbi:MAG: YggT family protein [Salinispira sp.]
MNIYKLFEIIGSIIDFYLLLISLRILLSWFAGGMNNAGMNILSRVTEPYLSIFRRARFFHVGLLDFSPLIGIFVLLFVSSLLRNFSLGHISAAVTLAVLAQTLFNAVSSITSVFFIIVLVRLFGLVINLKAFEGFWYRIDSFIQPLLLTFIRRILPRREVPYAVALTIFLVTCFLFIVLIRLTISPIVSLILLIPI